MDDAHRASVKARGTSIVKSVARTCQTLVYFDEVRRPLSVGIGVSAIEHLGAPEKFGRVGVPDPRR